MALMKCIECGKDVSEKAAACPHCGAPVPRSEQEPATGARTPVMGMVATGLGAGAVLIPYFAAVFFVPGAVICGLIACRKGQKGWGTTGVLLGLVGLVYIFYVSQQITSITSGETGGISLPQSPLAPPPVVTKLEYDRIQEGMTYEQVWTIIGAAGEEISRSDIDIAGYKTVMYSWTNSNGSNMNAMFQNGELVTKAQFGLQ